MISPIKNSSLNSVKNKWRNKVKKSKLDTSNTASKWKRCRKVLKQKSSSLEDGTAPLNEPLHERRASQSCTELSTLSRISEEGNSGHSESKIYRRKLFAKSRTQQISKSLDVPSLSQKSSAASSLKSSNASISSAENKCIIMLSSFEENTPPVVIFPENYYHQPEANNSRKSEMKKQVSFDDSITDSVEAKFSQLNFKDGLTYHSLVLATDSGSYTSTTNMSAISVGKQPSYRIIIFMWAYSLLFALFDSQLLGQSVKCSVATEVSSPLGKASILLALVLPLVCGPVLSGAIRRLLLVLENVKFVIRRSPSQTSIHTHPNSSFPFLLSLIHAISYTVYMVLSELLYPTYIDIFSYMLLKYCVGFSFSIIFPITALCTNESLRREVVRIYKYKPGVKKMTKEEKEQEIGKQMLKMQ